MFKDFLERSPWRLLIVLMFLIFSILALCLSLAPDQVTQADLAFSHWIFTWRQDWLTSFFSAVTLWGNTGSQVLAALTFFLLLGWLYQSWRPALVYLVATGLGAYGLNTLLKQVWQRPRPDLSYHLIDQTGYSFPSGHAMGVMITYGFFFLLLWSHLRRKHHYRGAGLFVVFVIFAFLMGLSRIYLGVHYLSDVVAGWSLGVTYVGIVWLFSRKRLVSDQ